MLNSEIIRNFITGVQIDCKETLLPPENGSAAIGQPIIPFTLIRNTRRAYLERITHQINITYTEGCFDACAVMIRRLVETLIIEVFEQYNISNKIKNKTDDFFYLSDLINITLKETAWNLSRNAKQAFPKLKDIGDKSAHSRRFIAIRDDIDRIRDDLRLVIQEMVLLAHFT